MKPVIKKSFIPTFFDDFFGDRFMKDSLFPVTENFRKISTPAINVKENDNSYIVEVAAPGMKKEEFNVDIEGNLLTISTEKKEEKVEEGEQYSRREFGYFSFKRSFTLPEDKVDVEAIEAKYTDGVLNLHIPKKEEEAKRRRNIDVA